MTTEAQHKRVAKWLGLAMLLFLSAPLLFFAGGAAPSRFLLWPLWALALFALGGCIYCLVRVVKALNV